jgi:hypothetical protein
MRYWSDGVLGKIKNTMLVSHGYDFIILQAETNFNLLREAVANY